MKLYREWVKSLQVAQPPSNSTQAVNSSSHSTSSQNQNVTSSSFQPPQREKKSKSEHVVKRKVRTAEIEEKLEAARIPSVQKDTIPDAPVAPTPAGSAEVERLPPSLEDL